MHGSEKTGSVRTLVSLWVGDRDEDGRGRSTGHSCFCGRDSEDGGPGAIWYYRILKPPAPGTELEVWLWSKRHPSKCRTVSEYARTQTMP